MLRCFERLEIYRRVRCRPKGRFELSYPTARRNASGLPGVGGHRFGLF